MTVDMKSLLRLAKARNGEPRDDLKGVKHIDSLDSDGLTQLIIGSDPKNSVYCERMELHGVSISNDFLPLNTADNIFRFLKLHSDRFIQLRGRLCLPLGGKATLKGLVPTNDIPAWMHALMKHVHECILKNRGYPAPNHALINVYEPGDGIMAHEDGPAYTPYATVLSVGSSCVFDFLSKDSPRRILGQVYLPVGSLLLFCEEAYTSALHEFATRTVDTLSPDVANACTVEKLGLSRLEKTCLIRGPRISITMRHVPLAPRKSD